MDTISMGIPPRHTIIRPWHHSPPLLQTTCSARTPEPEAPARPRPLADRLRPRALEEVVGQDHLLGPDGTLTRMLARGSLASLIL